MAIPRIRGGSLSPAQKPRFRDDVSIPVQQQEEGAQLLPALEKTRELIPTLEQQQGEGFGATNIPDPMGEAIPVPSNLKEEQIEAQTVADPMTFDQVLGDEATTSGTAEALNQRLLQLTQAQQKGQMVNNEVIDTDKREPVIPERKVEPTEVSSIFQRAGKLSDSLSNPDNIIMGDVRDPSIQVPAGTLVNNILPNVDMDTAAMALDIATLKEVSDINTMRLMNQNQQEATKVDDPDMIMADYFEQTDPNEFRGDLENQNIGDVKSQVDPDDPNKLDIDQYKFIHNTAKRLVERAKEMVGAPRSDEDNANNEAELGEYLLQRGIDEGIIGIYSFTDGRSGKKYYYPQVLKDGDDLAKTAETIAYAMNPQADSVNLGSKVPTNYMGPMTGYKVATDKSHVIKPDGTKVSPTEATLSIMGGVAREVDPDVYNIVEALFNMNDGKYFKMDPKEYEITFNEALLREKAKLANKGLPPEQIEAKAKAKAKLIADRSMETKKQKNARDLMLMKNRLNDVDENGNQKFRFAEWSSSMVNNRIQEKSRDMQSDSKAVIRAVDNFGEKGYIRKVDVKEGRSKDQASRLRNILMLNDRQMRNGEKALERFNALPQDVQVEMSAKAMWTGTYLKIADDVPTYQYTKSSVPRKPNTKRMNPAQLLDYFAQNENTIMGQLAAWGNVVKGWAEDPSKIPPPDKREPWMEHVLERGELGYNVTNLIDAANYVSHPEGGIIKLKGMYEIDANNSNIAIQSIKTGNILKSATLGFIVDPDNPDAWYDTMKNPDSFYKILSENLNDIADRTFTDKDKASSLKNFVNAIIAKGKAKDLTRDSVVAGFYGLHPMVNVGSIRNILSTFNAEAQEHLVNNGPYDTLMSPDMMNDLLSLQGANYNDQLQNISISKTIKNLGSIIALVGNFDPKIKTDIGDIVKSQVGELMPEYMQEMAYESVTGGRIVSRKPKMTYINEKGQEVPFFREGKRIDDRKERYTVDANGEVKDIHKEHGARFMDGLSAIITHTQDAALEKIALMSQNVGRKLSAPNISIHDANKLNAKSFIGHWISYNTIAVPSLAAQTDSYQHIYDIAVDAVKQLGEIQKQAAQEGKNIPVGTSNSNHRALFSIFDYHYEHNNKPIPESLRAERGDKVYRDTVKRREETMKLLEQAMTGGWVPKDPNHKTYQDIKKEGGDPLEVRRNAAVTPDQFGKLVNSALTLQGFKKKEGQLRSPIEKKINTWKNEADKQRKLLEQGRFLSNTQN